MIPDIRCSIILLALDLPNSFLLMEDCLQGMMPMIETYRKISKKQ